MNEFTGLLQETDELLERGEDASTVLQHLMKGFNSLGDDFGAELKGGEVVLRGEPPEPLKTLFYRESKHLMSRAEQECRQVGELQRLSRASRMISSSVNLAATLQAILQMALDVTGARYGIFRLLEVENHELVTAAVAGEQLDAPLVEALSAAGDHITGWVARNKSSLRIDDLREPPWCETYVPLDQELEMRSELAVPLLGSGERLEGVLNLESPRVGAFSGSDQLLLETFAGQAVVAIQQARLVEGLQEISAGTLEWPYEDVLNRVTELSELLLNATGVELEHGDDVVRRGRPEGQAITAALEPEGHLKAYLQNPADWSRQVLGCLAHHATLALKNKRRIELLRSTQQRQALTETFAAVGDLSANLLHQLNNKVGVIPVRVEGILDKCSDIVAQESYLNRNLNEIGASAQKALEIVRQNLSILKPRASGPVNLDLCLKRAVKELELEDLVEGRLDLRSVQGDVRSLTLVFLNLLENAARVMENKGRILVVGEQQESRVIVRVADNGPGIPQERQADIFQLNTDRSRPHNLGFGLWWVRTVMERMEGSVSVQSDGKTGTTFTLEFPLR